MPKESKSEGVPFFERHEIALLFLACALTLALYAKTLHGPFIFGDLPHVANNPAARMERITAQSLAKALGRADGEAFRPLATLSFALNYRAGRLETSGYHAVNMAVHVLAGLALYFFLKITMGLPACARRFGPPGWVPFFSALLWLVHPLQTQTAAYIAQRANGMAAFFLLTGFVLYARARLAASPVASRGLFLACVLSFLMAAGSKETALAGPAFLLLYEWFFFQDLSLAWLRRKWPLILGVAALCVFVALAQVDFGPWEYIRATYRGREFTLGQRVLTEFRVLVYYLSLIFFPLPSRLNIVHDFPLSRSLFDPPSTFFSLLFLTALLACAVAAAKKERLVSFAILWFLGNLLIESSVLGLELVFEHRLYLPSTMACFLAVFLVRRLFPHTRLAAVALGAAAVVLCVWTYQRNALWADGEALWRDSIKKAPMARSYANLGMLLLLDNRPAQARRELTKAMQADGAALAGLLAEGGRLARAGAREEAARFYERALSIKSRYAQEHHDMGAALAAERRFDQAAWYFRKALELSPAHADARHNLAVVCMEMGKTGEAVEHFKELARMSPSSAEAFVNLGDAEANNNQLYDAIQTFQKALALGPQNARAHDSLGRVLFVVGKKDEAIRHFRTALALDPSCAGAKAALAQIKKIETVLARYDKGITKIKERIERSPKSAALYNRLGMLYKEKGDLATALSLFEKARDFAPEAPEVFNNIGLVLMMQQNNAKAQENFSHALALAPRNVAAHYNMACLYARQNQPENAVAWLEKLAALGFDKFVLIEKDHDFDKVRSTGAFSGFRARHGMGSGPGKNADQAGRMS